MKTGDPAEVPMNSGSLKLVWFDTQQTSNDDTSGLGNCELVSQSMLKLCGWSSTGSDLTSLCEIRPAKTTPSPKPPVRTHMASLWRLEVPLSLSGSNWFRLVPGEGC